MTSILHSAGNSYVGRIGRFQRKRGMIILPDLLTLVVFDLLDCSNFLATSHEDCHINLYKQ